MLLSHRRCSPPDSWVSFVKEPNKNRILFAEQSQKFSRVVGKLQIVGSLLLLIFHTQWTTMMTRQSWVCRDFPHKRHRTFGRLLIVGSQLIVATPCATEEQNCGEEQYVSVRGRCDVTVRCVYVYVCLYVYVYISAQKQILLCTLAHVYIYEMEYMYDDILYIYMCILAQSSSSGRQVFCV